MPESHISHGTLCACSHCLEFLSVDLSRGKTRIFDLWPCFKTAVDSYFLLSVGCLFDISILAWAISSNHPASCPQLITNESFLSRRTWFRTSRIWLSGSYFFLLIQQTLAIYQSPWSWSHDSKGSVVFCFKLYLTGIVWTHRNFQCSSSVSRKTQRILMWDSVGWIFRRGLGVWGHIHIQETVSVWGIAVGALGTWTSWYFPFPDASPSPDFFLLSNYFSTFGGFFTPWCFSPLPVLLHFLRHLHFLICHWVLIFFHCLRLLHPLMFLFSNTSIPQTSLCLEASLSPDTSLPPETSIFSCFSTTCCFTSWNFFLTFWYFSFPDGK